MFELRLTFREGDEAGGRKRWTGEQRLQREMGQDVEMEGRGVGEERLAEYTPGYSGGMAALPWRAGSPPLNKVLWLLVVWGLPSLLPGQV